MDRLEKDPESLTRITTAEYAERGGWEGAEVIMWLIMRGAMAPRVRKLHQSYYLPSMTAIGTLIFEDDVVDVSDESPAAYLDRISHEVAGAEKLEGTYPFTLDLSVRAYRLNSFLHDLIIPEQRKKFLEDEEATFEEAGLTDEERALVRNRDWRGLIHYGVIFFMLEKLGAVVGTTNLHIYAAMRGESLEDFQKTRNAQVLYSVAGQDEGKTDWDTKN
jgi:gallate dioxygenase